MGAVGVVTGVGFVGAVAAAFAAGAAGPPLLAAGAVIPCVLNMPGNVGAGGTVTGIVACLP